MGKIPCITEEKKMGRIPCITEEKKMGRIPCITEEKKMGKNQHGTFYWKNPYSSLNTSHTSNISMTTFIEDEHA
jgi:hypothetical protein